MSAPYTCNCLVQEKERIVEMRCSLCGRTVLSVGELRVAALLAKGHRNNRISALLNRSAKTIATHKARIRTKMGIKTDVEWMEFLRRFANDAEGKPT